MMAHPPRPPPPVHFPFSMLTHVVTIITTPISRSVFPHPTRRGRSGADHRCRQRCASSHPCGTLRCAPAARPARTSSSFVLLKEEEDAPFRAVAIFTTRSSTGKPSAPAALRSSRRPIPPLESAEARPNQTVLASAVHALELEVVPAGGGVVVAFLADVHLQQGQGSRSSRRAGGRR